MHPDIAAFNEDPETVEERQICETLAITIDELLPEAERKIWHRHPVWFLDGNPIVGYSKRKAAIRLMFWSGASFNEDALNPGTGKFKDASMTFTHSDQINRKDIQWD